MSFAFMPVYTGDYQRDTGHLSPAKHGIYFKLLMHCWDTKGPAPIDEQELAGIANCRSADEVEALRYVLGRYFVLMDDGWYNPRMSKEIERAEGVSRVRSQAGRKGYEARAKHLPSKSSASAKQVHLPPPPPPPLQETSIGEPFGSPSVGGQVDEAAALQRIDDGHAPVGTPGTTPHPDDSESPTFDAFWQAYPKKVGKGDARRVWAKLKTPTATLRAVLVALRWQTTAEQWTREGGRFVPNPGTYLRQERWKDDPATYPGAQQVDDAATLGARLRARLMREEKQEG